VESDIISDVDLTHIRLLRSGSDHVDRSRCVVVYGSSRGIVACEELLVTTLDVERMLRIHGATLGALHLRQCLWREVVGGNITRVMVKSHVEYTISKRGT